MNNSLQLKIMVGFAALAMGVSDSDALSYEAASGRSLAVTNHPVVIAHRDDLSKGRLCPDHLSNGAGINIADPSAQKFRIQSRVSSDENIIVEENFDLWEDGTESAPEYAGNLEGYYADSNCFDVLPDRMMHGGHWAGIGLCSAGGSLGLTYPRYGGYIQTPMGDYSGELHITARARVLEGQQVDAASLIITVAKENWNNPVPVGGSDYYTMFAIPNDGEWHDIEWIYANNYGGDDCFVQFNTYSMLLLDDLKISSVLGELPKPELLPATDFTYDGFTANWKEVTMATDYLLTCWRNVVTDDTPITITESFEDIRHTDGLIDEDNPNYPDGWEFDFGEQEPQLFISDDNLEGNALKLTATGQTVTTPSTGSLITSLSFKMRFIGTPEIFTDPESGEVIFINVPGYFDLSGWDGYQWNRFGSAYVDPSGCDTFVEVDLTKHVAGKYLRLQLRAKGLGEDATLAIDDFKIETEPAISPEYVFDNEPVATTSYKFTGLDPASDYYYSVIARNTDLGIDSGEAGDAIFAFGLPAIEVLPPSEIDLNGEYTANWVASPKAQEYEVENFKVYTAPEDMTDFNILEDAFSYVDYGFSTENPYSFNNMELINLDYYCDNPGWVGYMCGLADHAIGGIGSAVYGVSGQLQTPFMCLNKMIVRISA